MRNSAAIGPGAADALRLTSLACALFIVWAVSPLAGLFVAALVFVAGAPHGAPEETVAGLVAPGLSYGARYLAWAALAALAWWLSPVLALLAFLAVAALHFGEDDPSLKTAGLWVVFGPFALHGEATLAVFAAMTGADLSDLTAPFTALAVLAFLALTAEMLMRNCWLYGMVLVGIGLLLPPVLSVAAYYGGVHAVTAWRAIPDDVRASKGLLVCGTLAIGGGGILVSAVALGRIPLNLGAGIGIALATPHVVSGLLQARHRGIVTAH